MSKVLKVMCGIPGSGKSTWIREHISPDTKVISRDEIRFSMLKKEDKYFSKEKEVWREFISQTRRAIDIYDDVIVDATHINATSRKKLLNALRGHLEGVKIYAIFMATPLDIALERNTMREGKERVPDSAICNMFNITTVPAFEEGFEKVCIVFTSGEIKILEAPNHD